MIVQTLTLWDSRNEPPENEHGVWRWNGYAQTDSTKSLLKYVEAHDERLRSKYLAWIHDLGESRYSNRSLAENLVIDNGLSYWWMTLLVEKSPWKSPSINDAIRLMALEEIVIESAPATLVLVSANFRLNEAVRELCGNMRVAYKWRRLGRRFFEQWSLTNAYRLLPQKLQALVSFARYLVARWPLRWTDKSTWFGGDRALFVCSYFIHLDVASCKQGQFHSHQWEGLPNVLYNEGYALNWMQHYLPSSTVPNTEIARDWVKSFNRRPLDRAFHSFLDAYLSLRIVFRVLMRWLRLNLIHLRLRKIRDAFRPRDSNLSLWPIMRRDWHASLCGSAAISNLLWIELFDAAFADLPNQRIGFYLCEGQSWERALIYAWRKHGHGRLVGVAHSTVRFWDLRYFVDPRTIRSSGPNSLPLPELTALNGKAAIDAYSRADYPSEGVTECEAVRYIYLNNHRSRPAPLMKDDERIRVLILGDVSHSSTKKLLHLLEVAVELMPMRPIFTVKFHPNCLLPAELYPSLCLAVLTNALGEILCDFDIAYTSSSTSAAVDAYLSGLSVIVMLDGTELNFSPLRGRPGITFVSAPEELAVALGRGSQNMPAITNPDDLFFLGDG